MTKTAHTPGPWTYNQNGISGNGTCTVYASREGRNVKFPIAQISTLKIREEELVNARLIAAAPELLECLERISDCVKPEPGGALFHYNSAVMDLARAAIAKAKGN